jgi:hypothetical protein
MEITDEMVDRASARFAAWRPSRPTHREAMRAALETALGGSHDYEALHSAAETIVDIVDDEQTDIDSPVWHEAMERLRIVLGNAR